MRLEIRTVGDRSDLRRLARFLLTQALWYPRYARWVNEVCIPEIDLGQKNALIAYERGGMVGDIVWQPHKELPRTRELKNLRVDPSFRRRSLAYFLLRQAEAEDKGSFDRVVCDVDKRQASTMKLLQFAGYKPIGEMPIYSSANTDVIFAKELGPVAQ